MKKEGESDVRFDAIESDISLPPSLRFVYIHLPLKSKLFTFVSSK